MNNLAKYVVAALALLLICLPACAGSQPSPGDLVFDLDGWGGPAVPVQVFVPEGADRDTTIVIVMHGASRDLPRYYADWRAAAVEHGFIIAVPYFSKEDFRGSARYNLGHVFDPDTRERRSPATWTFAAIEPLFDAIVEQLGGRQMHYTLFGHSAGSQFVHRFLYYVPDARVSRAIVANAGWYTMPDFGVAYPYGLAWSGVPESVLGGYFERDIVVLLGDADTVREDEDLRKTPEAELQGRHRFDRGHTFYRVAKARAADLGVDFAWRLQVVPSATHSNAEMTPAAALLIE